MILLPTSLAFKRVLYGIRPSPDRSCADVTLLIHAARASSHSVFACGSNERTNTLDKGFDLARAQTKSRSPCTFTRLTLLHSHAHRAVRPARPDGRLAGDERESRQIRCGRCDSAHGTPKNSDAAAALASLLGGPGGVSLVTSASCSRSSEPTSPTIVTLSRVTPLPSLSCEIWGDVGRCTEIKGDVGRCRETYGEQRRCSRSPG